MLSKLTEDDQLAIFKKLTPVSFIRVYRASKLTSKFIQENTRRFKIHIGARVLFREKGNIEICRDGKWEEIPYRPTLHSLNMTLSENLIDCFVFQCVTHNLPLHHSRRRHYSNPILERVVTIPAKKLDVERFGSPFPAALYNYESVRIADVEKDLIDPLFDRIQRHQKLDLQLNDKDYTSLDKVVNRSCLVLEQMVAGSIITKRIEVMFDSLKKEIPETIKRALRQHGSEIIVPRERLEVNLIPISAYWLNGGTSHLLQ